MDSHRRDTRLSLRWKRLFFSCWQLSAHWRRSILQMLKIHLPTLDSLLIMFSLLLYSSNRPMLSRNHISVTHKMIFNRHLLWIMIAVTGSYFLTGANTNSDVTIHGDDSIVINELFYGLVADINHEFISLRGFCTCPVQFSDCNMPTLLYTVGTTQLEYEQIFWELSVGCIPLIGFLLSTSAWWYTESYVENIRDTYSRVILSQSSPTIHAIDASLPTQYRNQTLQHLISSMFIEPPILHNVHFSSFYNQCAPSSCSYTVVQRRDLFIVLVFLISICGGLKKLLRILVLLFSKVIFFLIDWCKHRDEQHSKSTDCFVFPAFHIYFGVSLENEQKEGLEYSKDIERASIYSPNERIEQICLGDNSNYLFLLTTCILILASPSRFAHLKHFFGVICKAVINVNLYPTESMDEVNLRQQKLNTRIYIILFTSCLCVFALLHSYC